MKMSKYVNYYNALADPGGATGTRPPTGSISFVFAYVFTKKCTWQRLVPPQCVSAPNVSAPVVYITVT